MLKKTSINLKKELPQSHRPRERLNDYGPSALSDQELLAIVLRTGTRSQNVMSLAQAVLKHFETLYDLKMASIQELQKIKGIGLVKATELKAMIELGSRLALANQVKLGRVSSSRQLGEMMVAELKDLQQEHLIGIFLNAKNEIIKKKTLFIGSLNQSVAHPREIFKAAIKCSAARIILVHNHPSGDIEPSQQDLEFTRRIFESGALIGIQVLDHLIVGEDQYYSLKESSVIL